MGGQHQHGLITKVVQPVVCYPVFCASLASHPGLHRKEQREAEDGAGGARP
jgi:hypothetical protein